MASDSWLSTSSTRDTPFSCFNHSTTAIVFGRSSQHWSRSSAACAGAPCPPRGCRAWRHIMTMSRFSSYRRRARSAGSCTLRFTAMPSSHPVADLNEADLKPCIMDIVLSPGDLLYMPRGVIHQAVSLQGSSSTHLTLSAYQRHAWSDLLAAMLPKLLERASHASVDLRRGLPRNFLGHAGSGAQRGAPSRERASFRRAPQLRGAVFDHVKQQI